MFVTAGRAKRETFPPHQPSSKSEPVTTTGHARTAGGVADAKRAGALHDTSPESVL
jgi:hypothetical protein